MNDVTRNLTHTVTVIVTVTVRATVHVKVSVAVHERNVQWASLLHMISLTGLLRQPAALAAGTPWPLGTQH